MLAASFILYVTAKEPCEMMSCTEDALECRYVHMCDLTKTCRAALPTCVYKDASYTTSSSCTRGSPVIDMRGADFRCTRDADCPVRFGCDGGVCCLPEVPTEPTGCSSLQYIHQYHDTVELCADQCLVHDHCLNHELCCQSGCSRRCIPTNETVQPFQTSPHVPSGPSGFDHAHEAPPSIDAYIRPSGPITAPGSDEEVWGSTDVGFNIPPSYESYDEAPSVFKDFNGNQDNPVPTVATSYADDLQPTNVYNRDGSNDLGLATKGNMAEPTTYYVDSPTDISNGVRYNQERPIEVYYNTDDPIAVYADGSNIQGDRAADYGGERPVEVFHDAHASSKPRVSPTLAPSVGLSGPVRAPAVIQRGPAVTSEPPQPTESPVSYPEKDGQCPSAPALVICGQRECDRDSVCHGDTKCCNTHCGRVCVSPEGGQRNIFQDADFGQSRTFSASNNDATHPNVFGSNNDATHPNVFGSKLKEYGLGFATKGNGPTKPPKMKEFPPASNHPDSYNLQQGPLHQYGVRPGATSGTSAASNSGANTDLFGFTNIRNQASPFGVGQISNMVGGKSTNEVLGNKAPFAISSPYPGSTGQMRGLSRDEGLIHGRRDMFGFGGSQTSLGNGGSSQSSSGSNGLSSMSSNMRSRSNDLSSGFGGYGANGFTGNGGGFGDLSSYGVVDPGAFGSIDQSEYEKLGLTDKTYSANVDTASSQEVVKESGTSSSNTAEDEYASTGNANAGASALYRDLSH